MARDAIELSIAVGRDERGPSRADRPNRHYWRIATCRRVTSIAVLKYAYRIQRRTNCAQAAEVLRIFPCEV